MGKLQHALAGSQSYSGCRKICPGDTFIPHYCFLLPATYSVRSTGHALSSAITTDIYLFGNFNHQALTSDMCVQFFPAPCPSLISTVVDDSHCLPASRRYPLSFPHFAVPVDCKNARESQAVIFHAVMWIEACIDSCHISSAGGLSDWCR
jgi:hypothetical protein